MEKEWGKEDRHLQIMNMEMVAKSTRIHLATRGAYQLVLDQMKVIVLRTIWSASRTHVLCMCDAHG